MKSFSAVLLFFTHSLGFAAQSQKVDSLLSTLENDLKAIEKARVYIQLAKETSYDSSQSVAFALKALTICLDRSFVNEEVDVLNQIGTINSELGNNSYADSLFNRMLDLSLKKNYWLGVAKANYGLGISSVYTDKSKTLGYFLEALKYSETAENRHIEALTLNRIGVHYKHSENLDLALDFYTKSVNLFIELGNTERISALYNNIGNVYLAFGNQEEAMSFYHKSVRLKEQIGDEKGMISTYGNMGEVLLEMGLYRESFRYLMLSMEGRERLNMRMLPFSYCGISKYYYKLNKLDSALYFATRALDSFDEKKLSALKYNAYFLIAEVWLEKGQLGSAKKFLSLARESAESRNNIEYLKRIYQLTAFLEERRGDFKSAYEAFNLHKKMSDSLVAKENRQEAEILMAKYEYKSKLDSIEYANEKEKIYLSNVIEREKFQKNGVIAVLIFLSAFLFIISRYYKLKVGSALELKEKNRQISGQAEKLKKFNHQLEEMVASRTKEVNEQREKLKKYAFSNSHLVRAPLARIIGLADMLNSDVSMSEVEKQLFRESIKSSAEELDVIIRKMGKMLI